MDSTSGDYVRLSVTGEMGAMSPLESGDSRLSQKEGEFEGKSVKEIPSSSNFLSVSSQTQGSKSQGNTQKPDNSAHSVIKAADNSDLLEDNISNSNKEDGPKKRPLAKPGRKAPKETKALERNLSFPSTKGNDSSSKPSINGKVASRSSVSAIEEDSGSQNASFGKNSPDVIAVLTTEDKKLRNILAQYNNCNIKSTKLVAGELEYEDEASLPFWDKFLRLIGWGRSSRQNNYRQGMEHVRTLLSNKYGENAVARFDKHFSYRMWAGSPLTVGALRTFIAEEDNCRAQTVDISDLTENARSLEEIKANLNKLDSSQKDFRIIGDKKILNARHKFVAPFFPIYYSFTSANADNESIRNTKEHAITSIQKDILKFFPDDWLFPEVVKMSFEKHFLNKTEPGNNLTVKELSNCIDELISAREKNNTSAGYALQVVAVGGNGAYNVCEWLYNFGKNAANTCANAVRGAIVLKQLEGVDSVAGVAKATVVTGAVLAAPDSTVLLTAAAHTIMK